MSQDFPTSFDLAVAKRVFGAIAAQFKPLLWTVFVAVLAAEVLAVFRLYGGVDFSWHTFLVENVAVPAVVGLIAGSCWLLVIWATAPRKLYRELHAAYKAAVAPTARHPDDTPGSTQHPDSPRLEIEFAPGTHIIRLPREEQITFTVHNVSGSRIENIRVFIERIRANDLKTASGQHASQFTNHQLAVLKSPPQERAGFSLSPYQSEVILLGWSHAKNTLLLFSGYSVNGALREQGFNTLKADYEVDIRVTADNAPPARATFRIRPKSRDYVTVTLLEHE